MRRDRAVYFFLLLIILIFSSGAEAQQDSAGKFVIYGDTVYTGRSYHILLTDKTENVCKLIAVSDKAVLVLTDGATRTFSLEEIIRIRPFTSHGEYSPTPEKGYRSITKYYIGTGISLPLKSGDYYTSTNYTAGIDLMGGILFVLGKNTGVRLDFEYAHIGRPDTHFKGYDLEEWHSGGSVDGFFARGNFQFGDFTNNDVSFFFTAGLGVCLKFAGEYESTYNYNYPVYTRTDRTASGIIPGLTATIGVSADFSVSRNLKVFVEPHFNVWSFFPVNYIAVRAGIIL